MNIWAFEYPNYTVFPMDSHLLFRMKDPPDIDRRNLVLRGGTIVSGQRIRGLCGSRTCAGYVNFRPVASAYVIYTGIFTDLQGTIALCRCRVWNDESVFVGWNVVFPKEIATLLSLVRAEKPASRIVNTDLLFLDANLPPN